MPARSAALIAALLLVAPSVGAQDSSTRADLDVSAIQSRIAVIQKGQLPASERKPLLKEYRAALASLRAAQRARRRQASLTRLADQAPAKLSEAQATLARLASSTVTIAERDRSLRQLSAKVAEAAARDEAAQARLRRLEVEPKRRAQRRLSLATGVVELQERLSRVAGRLAQPPPEGIPPRLAAAKRLRLLALRRELEARRRAQQAELESYDARRDLLPARLAVARRRAKLAASELAAWRQRETARRQALARRAAKKAERLQRQAATAEVEALQRLARQNRDLALQRTGEAGLPSRIQRETQEVEGLQAKLLGLRDRFRTLRRKLDAAGLTRAMGRYLRLELDRLPDPGAIERRLAALRDQISSAQFQQINWEEERRSLQQPDALVESLASQAPSDERGAARRVARSLVSERADLLDAVVEEQGILLQRLVARRELLSSLLKATRVFRTFIEERILWVRSVGQSPLRALPSAGPALAWLFASDDWPAALRRTAAEVRDRPAPALGWLLGLALAILIKLTVSRRRLERLCEAPWKPEQASLLRTLEGLVHTALVSLPLPLLLVVVAELLLAPPLQLGIGRAVGTGLLAAGGTLFALRLLTALLRPGALAEKHFRWRSQTTAYASWHLRWFTPLAASTTFLVATFDQQSHTAWNDSLGLLAFVVEMLGLAALAQRLVRPSGPVVAPILQRHPDGWVERLKYVWAAPAVLVPLFLAGFALLGYYDSALLLHRRLGMTLALALGLLTTSALLNRWLGLVRLRLALREGEEREAEEREATDDSEVAHGDAAPAALQGDGRAVFGSRARQLVSSALGVGLLLGLYGVWSDVLPAFKRLERLQVYPELAVLPPTSDRLRLAPLTGVDSTRSSASSPDAGSGAAEGGTSPAGSGGAGSALPSLPQPSGASTPAPQAATPVRVTAADLGMALLLLALTVLLAKNLPGLLEVALLQRLPFDAGVRYAIVTVLRYGIAMVGGAVTLKTAGIRWANIQWLAAALTFGLAFGLQEIFANFVSGLIILVERPVRVGDAVTVGEVSGTVTRLQMRATTITDWDNKELIIPNKEFVTGQVINWSLSSPHLRLRIPIGIAYGSDVEEAERLLLEAAREHPDVLDEPPATAVFLAFGASSLDFELRVFIPHPKYRFTVRHQLLERINRRFADAGIEISFPQQDVHLMPSAPLLEALGAGDPS